MSTKLSDFYEKINRLYDEKNFVELEKSLLEQLGEELTSKEDDSILISVLNEIATFYRGQNQPEKSIEYLQMAAEVAKELIGRDSKEYATLLMNLSAAYRISKEGQKALEIIDEAIEILKGLGEEQRYFYCAAVNNKGMAYLGLGKAEEARACFEEAIMYLRNLGFDNDPNTEEICVSMINIAFTYYEEKMLDKAEMYCRDIIKKYEGINEAKKEHLYALYTLMGDIYTDCCRKEDARKAYQTAMELVEEASGQNFEYKNIKKKLEKLEK